MTGELKTKTYANLCSAYSLIPASRGHFGTRKALICSSKHRLNIKNALSKKELYLISALEPKMCSTKPQEEEARRRRGNLRHGIDL